MTALLCTMRQVACWTVRLTKPTHGCGAFAKTFLHWCPTSCLAFLSVHLASFLFLGVMHADAGEVRLADKTVTELWEAASARQAKIKNVRVTYAVEWKNIADVPSNKDRVTKPYHFEFAYKSDCRRARYVPRNRREARLAVFDGARTVEVRRDKVLVMDGKSRTTENLEVYCVQVLDIPYTDYDKVTYDNSWFYPHCMRPRKPWQPRSGFVVKPHLESINGHWCYAVTWPERLTFWIDPDLNYALRQREEYRQDATGASFLAGRFIYSDFQEAIPGVFVPMECRMIGFAGIKDPPALRNTPVIEMLVHVDDIAINQVNDEDFKIKLLPGMTVYNRDDHIRIKGGEDRVISDFAQLAKLNIGDNDDVPDSSHALVHQIVVINAIVLVLLGVGWCARRRVLRSRTR